MADYGNNRFIRQEGGLRFFAAERAVYSIGAFDADYQLCQIGFSRRDGSLFVSAPYFPADVRGILSVATWPDSPPYTLSLQERGKATSHLVKFSHHPDGRVHFSQDGKIKSEIRRQSFALAPTIGHLFQLHVYHPYSFEKLTPERARKGRAYLLTRSPGVIPPAVVITAEWRRKADIAANIDPPGGTTGPVSRIRSRRTGQDFTATFLGQPPDFPLTTHVLLLTCYPTTMLPNVAKPTMIFIGGYDPHEARRGEDKKFRTKECLVWMYPCGSHDELAAKIGTVDFKQGSAA